MRILAIETSCDETAVAILETERNLEIVTFKILGDSLYSQAELHAPYGGGFPALAKREHQLNLVPRTVDALTQSGMLKTGKSDTDEDALQKMRDEGFRNDTKKFLEEHAKPAIDMIAVTYGPGLEPALWTGITFAEALGKAWGIPVLGIDHMEGHIVSGLLRGAETAKISEQEAEGRRQKI